MMRKLKKNSFSSFFLFPSLTLSFFLSQCKKNTFRSFLNSTCFVYSLSHTHTQSPFTFRKKEKERIPPFHLLALLSRGAPDPAGSRSLPPPVGLTTPSLSSSSRGAAFGEAEEGDEEEEEEEETEEEEPPPDDDEEEEEEAPASAAATTTATSSSPAGPASF